MCTHIIWLTKKKLTYYSGNYDTFRKTVKENEVIQSKKYQKEQDDIKHLKEFIASCGTYSNLVKQVCPPPSVYTPSNGGLNPNVVTLSAWVPRAEV